MVNEEWVSRLDADAACAELATAHADLLEVECRRLVLAAHWIDLHAPADEPDANGSRRVLPGMECTVAAGADGTPQISEFACAEFAAVQDLHPLAGRALLRKVANLRHRHPQLWARVRNGEVPGWKALETARITGKDDYTLTLDQAHWVDAQTSDWIDTLPWGAFLDLLEARIIAADPQAAELRRKEAEAARYIATGATTEHGLKTFIAQALAGDVIRIVALCDRIAQILADRGDLAPVDARRATAFGMLANPAHVLALLISAATDTAEQDPADQDADDHEEPEESGHEEPELKDSEGEEAGLLGERDLHPADNDADDAAEGQCCPTCGHNNGTGTDLSGLAAFTRHLPDLANVLPRARLYIHVTQHTLDTGEGVARMEGVGPITLGQVRTFLRHAKVTPIRVLVPADQHPVDGYEYPASLREATFLTSPRDVFPYAVSTSRRRDIDHPLPYLPPERGGPPGQTRLDNAAPMTRFHHRLKTFAGWHVRQPEPGTYLWRSPHGHYWLTTITGTHPLPERVGRTLWHALDAPDSRTAGRLADPLGAARESDQAGAVSA